MSRNVIALIGLETFKSKGKLRFAETFANNILTWKRDNPKDIVTSIDARKYRDNDNPMLDMWNDIKKTYVDGIDVLLYSGHSDWEGLYIISHYRKGDIPDSTRYVEYTTSWEGIIFKPNAEIRLMGCRAGGDYKVFDVCIAQDIANKTNTDVYAYTCKTSQKFRNGGYYQIPESGDFIKFCKK